MSMQPLMQSAASQLELLVNLLIATLLGGLIGLNRQLYNRPAGLRTHALISLSAALAVVVIQQLHPITADAASRVVQGAVTGIGFIGAGVIVHHERRYRVEGLTTAATIWLSAMLGLACGIGFNLIATAGMALALFVLTVGNWLEKKIESSRTPRPPPTITDDDQP